MRFWTFLARLSKWTSCKQDRVDFLVPMVMPAEMKHFKFIAFLAVEAVLTILQENPNDANEPTILEKSPSWEIDEISDFRDFTGPHRSHIYSNLTENCALGLFRLKNLICKLSARLEVARLRNSFPKSRFFSFMTRTLQNHQFFLICAILDLLSKIVQMNLMQAR